MQLECSLVHAKLGGQWASLCSHLDILIQVMKPGHIRCPIAYNKIRMMALKM